MISQTLISSYFITGAACLILPAAAIVVWKLKSKAPLSPYFAGAGIFVLFVLLIEGLINNLLLTTGNAFGNKILASLPLYALYGGLMAGLFEETGRLVAYKVFLRRHYQPETAITYGLGHGGIECVLVVGVSAVTYGLNALALAGGLPEGADPAVQNLYATLVAGSAAPLGPLWAILERFSAMIFHISASVIMFKAVSVPGKMWLYPVAILLHTLVNAVGVIASGLISSIFVVELIILALSLIIGYFALKMYKNMCKTMPRDLPDFS